MNKEERAENWFRNIPGEEKIPMEKKIELCGRVTIPIILICFGILSRSMRCFVSSAAERSLTALRILSTKLRVQRAEHTIRRLH